MTKLRDAKYGEPSVGTLPLYLDAMNGAHVPEPGLAESRASLGHYANVHKPFHDFHGFTADRSVLANKMRKSHF